MKKTALHDEHISLGARMVDFAGWEMPVQYEGVIEEHLNVRKNVGLFDVSHMGELFFRGPKALEDLQWLTTNDVSKLEAGQAQYSLLLNHQGGVVDDVFVYCVEKSSEYLMCVNASNTQKDFDWVTKNSKGSQITNESEKWAQIAIQGPKAIELTARVLGNDVMTIKRHHFKPAKGLFIARTGYTGEDGFEVFLPQNEAVSFWKKLLNEGKDLVVRPIGLGARDTLRTEMKYSLYGHEIDDETSPLDAGLGWVVKPAKGDFLGKTALESKKSTDGQKLIGFKMVDKGIPRQGYLLISFDNMEIGRVTSGTMSPSLKEPVGVGYIKKDWANPGKEFFVQIRGRLAKAHVVKTPFVSTELTKS